MFLPWVLFSNYGPHFIHLREVVMVESCHTTPCSSAGQTGRNCTVTSRKQCQPAGAFSPAHCLKKIPSEVFIVFMALSHLMSILYVKLWKMYLLMCRIPFGTLCTFPIICDNGNESLKSYTFLQSQQCLISTSESVCLAFERGKPWAVTPKICNQCLLSQPYHVL